MPQYLCHLLLSVTDNSSIHEHGCKYSPLTISRQKTDYHKLSKQFKMCPCRFLFFTGLPLPLCTTVEVGGDGSFFSKTLLPDHNTGLPQITQAIQNVPVSIHILYRATIHTTVEIGEGIANKAQTRLSADVTCGCTLCMYCG